MNRFVLCGPGLSTLFLSELKFRDFLTIVDLGQPKMKCYIKSAESCRKYSMDRSEVYYPDSL